MLDLDAIEQRFVGAFPDTPEAEAIVEMIAEIRRLRQFVRDSVSTCYLCETCGRARTTKECVWCERDRLRELCGEAAPNIHTYAIAMRERMYAAASDHLEKLGSQLQAASKGEL